MDADVVRLHPTRASVAKPSVADRMPFMSWTSECPSEHIQSHLLRLPLHRRAIAREPKMACIHLAPDRHTDEQHAQELLRRSTVGARDAGDEDAAPGKTCRAAAACPRRGAD